MVQAASPTFSRQDWLKGYESLKTEQAYWIDEIEGQIPKRPVARRQITEYFINDQQAHSLSIADESIES